MVDLVTTAAWGHADYSAENDAAAWLLTSPRSGPPSPTELDSALALRIARGLTALPFATWNFGDSVAFDALVETTEATGDEQWAMFARAWGRAWATRALPFARLDCTVPGHALVRVAQRYGDDLLLGRLSELADFLRRRPLLDGVLETWQSSPLLKPYGDVPLTPEDERWLAEPPAGIFVDCLHFDPPFFVRLGLAIGDDKLVADGVAQALAYIAALQTPSGLFDHFRLAGSARSFGPGWGRGQGWALLGLLDVLSDIPATWRADELAVLRGAVARLIAAMVATQRADGHWPVVVTESDSGDEYSTTAFMVTGFSRAAAQGLVAWHDVEQSIRSARTALKGSFDAAGNLCEVSAAVYASTVDEHYRHVPRGYVVPWGQGPALMAVWASHSTEVQ